MAASQQRVQSKPRRIKTLLSSFLRKDPEQERVTSTSKPSDGDNSDTDKCDSQSSKPSVTVTPLNKENFLQRVDTYSTSTWFAKPLELSPLQCARYGWQNIDVDTLCCVSCKEVLYVSLPQPWQKEEYSSACDKVREQLQSAHGKICPWSGSPSPDSFVTISMANHKDQIFQYQQRVTQLVGFFTSLPCVEFSVLKDQPVESSVVLKCLTDFSKGRLDTTREQITDDEWNIVVMMALFGWQKKHSHSLPIVMCECCRKQAGLWNYASRETNLETVENTEDIESDFKTDKDDGEPPHKRIKKIKQSSFNPATEHRPWCPWICVNQASADSKLQKSPLRGDTEASNHPLWQSLLEILLCKADPSKFGSNSPLTNKVQTPPNNAWKAVRRLVSFWQSSEISTKTGTT
ncbi:NIPA-like protein [Holothuria leucospilota]|uniref:NIPA-like protein n=1 Tax=Holothuria leucospilota TaxID=206669 RepID=A0A9Q1CLB5_HOLLE|nr:NIPA-like protein [Holothuria leucospilota]